MTPFWEVLASCSKSQGEHVLAFPGLLLWEYFLIIWYVVNLKPTPQAEAPGQIAHLHRRTGSVYYLCGDLGGEVGEWLPVKSCLAECFSFMGSRNTVLLSHESQVLRGVPCVGFTSRLPLIGLWEQHGCGCQACHWPLQLISGKAQKWLPPALLFLERVYHWAPAPGDALTWVDESPSHSCAV